MWVPMKLLEPVKNKPLDKKKIEDLIKYIMDELFLVITEEDACYCGHGFDYKEFINKHYRNVRERIKHIANN